MVVLPAEPRGPDDPLICGTCGSEVPDYRIQAAQAAAEAAGEPVDETPASEKRYSRSSLLQGVRDAVAERGIQAVRELGSRTKF
jgi:hypothetical protein